MKIQLKNIGKKYGKNWIFHSLNCTINYGDSCAIVGNNGSGKSTLLKLIAGVQTPSKGEIDFEGTTSENIYQSVSYCAPYVELIEEMTLTEILDFHQKFRPFIQGIDTAFVVDLLGFKKEKLIKEYSSGMKQRVKLALAFFSEVPLILLDEPTSNLDKKGIEWYLSLVNQYKKDRTLIVASNMEEEYSFCQQQINILDFK